MSVYDADTIRADIDLGFNIWKFDEALRLNRINTPEVKGLQRPQGLLSKAFFLTQLAPGATIWIRTEKDEQDKYGRYLADIYPKGFDGQCLNDLLVVRGFAKYYDGTGPKPV